LGIGGIGEMIGIGFERRAELTVGMMDWPDDPFPSLASSKKIVCFFIKF
jgi:hypothetical protein